MRTITLALAVLVTACGSGGTESPIPAPVPTAVVPQSSTVVFIGDSITVGMMSANTNPDYVNAGVSGQTSVQMLARFQSDVLDRHPVAVVILAGTNDILRTSDPNTDSIARMAELAAHANARVVIGLIPPNENWDPPNVITDPVAGRAEVQRFNQALRNLAAGFGYRIADYYSALILPDGSQNAALFVADHTHPNLDGIAVEWRVIGLML